jgi:hypothetical protein
MRLEEPLQGIILMQGHTVMHLSMFAASFMVTKRSYDPADWMKMTAWEKNIWAMFYWLAWLHLLTALLQIAQT